MFNVDLKKKLYIWLYNEKTTVYPVIVHIFIYILCINIYNWDIVKKAYRSFSDFHWFFINGKPGNIMKFYIHDWIDSAAFSQRLWIHIYIKEPRVTQSHCARSHHWLRAPVTATEDSSRSVMQISAFIDSRTRDNSRLSEIVPIRFFFSFFTWQLTVRSYARYVYREIARFFRDTRKTNVLVERRNRLDAVEPFRTTTTIAGLFESGYRSNDTEGCSETRLEQS